MAIIARTRPIRPGERAPDFDLPAADRDDRVSLRDYTGRSAVFLTLLSGIYCPFCRRHVAQLARTAEKLAELRVATLAVIATPAERARLYFRMRPSAIPLGADPELVTHRAYGVPNLAITPAIQAAVEGVAQRVARDLGLAVSPGRAYQTLAGADGFKAVESDERDMQRQQAQFYGQFLVDGDGIVRWAYIEGERRGLEEIERLPDDDEVLAVARSL